MAKRFLYEKMKEAVNAVSGPMTQSSFQKTGKLTPQEFLEAGDALVQKFPAWEWIAGKEEILPFLPPNKKFLCLKKCPCAERASAMMDVEGGDRDCEDEWVETHTGHVAKKPSEAKAVEEPKEVGWSDEEDEAKVTAEDAPEQPKIRLYDVTVVYDQFHATPRVYLFGYSEENQNKPLTKEEMMDDVYAENREKTVTVDPHPFATTPCISIHPCRHAETMQRILQRMSDRCDDEQEDLDPKERIPFVFPTYLALFVFLKFISSVVPTISYDISFDMDM